MKKAKNYIENFVYMVTNCFRWDFKNSLIVLFLIPVRIFMPVLSALIPKLLLELTSQQFSTKRFALQIAIIVSILTVFAWLEPAICEKLLVLKRKISMQYAILIFEKIMYIDYSKLESPKYRLLVEKCKCFAFGPEGPRRTSLGANIVNDLIGLFVCCLGSIIYASILFNQNYISFLFILIPSIIEYICFYEITKSEIKMTNDTLPNEMTFNYFFRLSTDPSANRNIQINASKFWLKKKLQQELNLYVRALEFYKKRASHISFLYMICHFFKNFGLMSFLTMLFLRKNIDLSDFIFLCGISSCLSNYISNCFSLLPNIQYTINQCQFFRDFINEEDVKTKTYLKEITEIENIVLKNVSFSYGSKRILNNISFSVKKGERIAIVGENGAGKSTLIKLLMGLLQPTEGKITVNNIDISSLDKRSYFRNFSAVFQDYNILPMSILNNICIGKKGSNKKLDAAIKRAGFDSTISQLPNGVNTTLIKQVNKAAIDLSGGEKQRLLLSRALYKDSHILVLDEPASSLDPIAEEDLYLHYSKIASNKICFFVSHRLSSTQFCDKIFFIKDGKITEMGTHDELCMQRGDYWQMYNTQSYFYNSGELK